MKAVTTILLLILTIACARRSYDYASDFTTGMPRDLQRITIDESYALYRRDVLKDAVDGKFIVRESKVKSSDPNMLIEVEYLLVSADSGNVVYITTIPDRRQVYYQRNKLPPDMVNIQDFNSFHLGKIVANDKVEFQFKNEPEGNSNTWELYQSIRDTTTDVLSLKRLAFNRNGQLTSEMRADLALADTVEFRQVGKFYLVLSKPIKKNEERKIIQSLDNTIYVKEKNTAYNFLFRFKEPINKKDSAISFNNQLIKFTPKPLFNE